MNEHVIQTSKGPLCFQPVALFHGRGRIDRHIASENLLSLKKVFEQADLRFGLIYGTLLGAVRDNDFIQWDEDVDVFILDEDREKLYDAFWGLQELGISLIRKEGDLYSVMSGDNYIDIYVFRRVGSKRWCNADVLSSSFLEFVDKVSFLNTEFFAPKNPIRFLETVYGQDWRTPKHDYPARPWSMWRRFKRVIRDAFPFVLTIRDRLFQSRLQ